MSTMNAQHEYRLSRRRSMSYYPRNRKPKIFPGKGPAKKFIMMVFFGSKLGAGSKTKNINRTMMQFFEWYLPNDGLWWKRCSAKADNLAEQWKKTHGSRQKICRGTFL